MTAEPARARRVDSFDVVAFDADDTLWLSEDSFVHAEHRFVELVSPYVADGVDLSAALRAMERNDISITGYGVKAFTLSMASVAVAATDGRVPGAVVGEIIDLGRAMLTEPVHLLPHVTEVLSVVSASVRTVMITKGDLVHQTRKVETSGIDHHFDAIEIVLEKDPDAYAKILRRLGVAPERFLMIGNSVRSDVLPVMELGGHAIHVPYHIVWDMERADGHGQEIVELSSIADVPIWLGLTPF
ncbi:MAG: HAD family hydrolase [Ilumatobacteraceae bacterium]